MYSCAVKLLLVWRVKEKCSFLLWLKVIPVTADSSLHMGRSSSMAYSPCIPVTEQSLLLNRGGEKCLAFP